MLEVRYQNTFDDLRRVARSAPWRLRLATAAGFWGMVALAALPATLALAALGNWNGLAVGWLLWGLLALLLRYTLWRKQQSSLRAAEQRSRPTTTSITPAWIESRTDRCRIRSNWLEIEHVVVTAEHVIMVTYASVVHLVPRRAFASATEAEEFARAAQEHHRAAQQLGQPQYVPEPLAIEAGDGVFRITYRNTPAEFDKLQSEGLQKPGQPANKHMSWRGAILLTGLGLAVAALSSGNGATATVFGGALALFTTNLGMVTMILPLFRRLNLISIKRMCQTDRSITISAAGVSLVDLQNESFAKWSEYSSIEEDERFIVFFQNERTHVAHLIPKQAFAEAGMARQFFALAEQYWLRAQPAPELPAPVETGNPYQSPAAT